MTADYGGYLAVRDLVTRAGPWLLWPGALAAWAAVALSFFRWSGKRWRNPATPAVAAVFVLLTGGFILLVWYHWKIFGLLPLELPSQAAEWVNRQLAAQAARGGGSLGLVDWSRPPRFAIPFWIEGEKFFFWTLVMAAVVFFEERRGHRGYLFVLRLMLALQVTGLIFYSNPFSPPLPLFHQEISTWFTSDPFVRMQYFFKIFPRMKFYYNAAYMWLHPPMLFIAYATLAGTFAASLFQFKKLYPKLDKAAYSYAKLGYILLTFGMLVGYPWAIIAWGPNWWWDPKIASSIMMWLLYSAYLHHRFLAYYRHGRWQVAALGVLCYFSLIFTYFMSWYFPGEHTF